MGPGANLCLSLDIRYVTKSTFDRGKHLINHYLQSSTIAVILFKIILLYGTTGALNSGSSFQHLMLQLHWHHDLVKGSTKSSAKGREFRYYL